MEFLACFQRAKSYVLLSWHHDEPELNISFENYEYIKWQKKEECVKLTVSISVVFNTLQFTMSTQFH